MVFICYDVAAFPAEPESCKNSSKDNLSKAGTMPKPRAYVVNGYGVSGSLACVFLGPFCFGGDSPDGGEIRTQIRVQIPWAVRRKSKARDHAVAP